MKKSGKFSRIAKVLTHEDLAEIIEEFYDYKIPETGRTRYEREGSMTFLGNKHQYIIDALNEIVGPNHYVFNHNITIEPMSNKPSLCSVWTESSLDIGNWVDGVFVVLMRTNGTAAMSDVSLNDGIKIITAAANKRLASLVGLGSDVYRILDEEELKKEHLGTPVRKRPVPTPESTGSSVVETPSEEENEKAFEEVKEKLTAGKEVDETEHVCGNCGKPFRSQELYDKAVADPVDDKIVCQFCRFKLRRK